MYDIEFLNKSTGWAVGTGGTIIKTTNGGINWFAVSHPVGTRLLSSIHLVDSNYAYVVGDFETIIKTTNGGVDWITLRYGSIGEGDSYEGLFFVNRDTGWICGTGEKVLKTTNGGISFDSTILFWGYLMDMYFKDASTGLITTSGNIFKTTDGGLIWNAVNMNLHGSFPEFKKLSCINNKYGWVVAKAGNRTVYKTANFGSDWDSISFIPSFPIWLYCIEFSDSLTGWIGGEQGVVYKTTNGGFNWTLQNSNTNNLITSLWFYNNDTGWASCGFGGLLYTSNGGLTKISNEITNNNLIDDFKLFQNYPNPFNPETDIEFEIRKSGLVKIQVYNLLGEKIKELVNEKLDKGRYKIKFNASNLSSGIFFYDMNFDRNFVQSKAMILLK